MFSSFHKESCFRVVWGLLRKILQSLLAAGKHRGQPLLWRAPYLPFPNQALGGAEVSGAGWESNRERRSQITCLYHKPTWQKGNLL